MGAAGYAGLWKMVCKGPDGKIKWVEQWHNLIVDEGLNESLNVTLGNQTQSASWYIGMISGTVDTISGQLAAGDTLASNAWTEVPFSSVSESVRGLWDVSGVTPVSGESISNPTPVTYNFTSAETVGGAFLCSVSSGTAGILFSEGVFGSSGAEKTLGNGDTLDITATITSQDVV
jgi:hypothetical protein